MFVLSKWQFWTLFGTPDAPQCAHFFTDICCVIQEGVKTVESACTEVCHCFGSASHCYLDKTNMDKTSQHQKPSLSTWDLIGFNSGGKMHDIWVNILWLILLFVIFISKNAENIFLARWILFFSGLSQFQPGKLDKNFTNIFQADGQEPQGLRVPKYSLTRFSIFLYLNSQIFETKILPP